MFSLTTTLKPPPLTLQKAASSGGLFSRFRSPLYPPAHSPAVTTSAYRPSHSRPTEWVEMQEIPLAQAPTVTNTLRGSTSQEEYGDDDGLTMVVSRGPSGEGMYERAIRWWKRYINVSVDIRASRDHLAIERTFLSYLRTSSIGAVTGTMISQLFIIEEASAKSFSFFLGQVLATICYSFSIITVCVGAYRIWRLQEALIHAKGLAGGAEPTTVFVLAGLVILTFLGLIVALDIMDS